MTTNHHTPQVTLYELTAANDNAPLSELDSAISAVIGADLNAIELQLGAQSNLTISSGAVSFTKSLASIDTQASAASDDLDNINGTSNGQIGIFFAANDARTVVIKHGTGNIRTWDGNDITLDSVNKGVIFINRGFTIYILGFVGSGGGGGGAPNYSAGAAKTLVSDVIAAGTDRNLIVASESGTTDDLIEVTGLTVGDVVLLRADSGNTITVKHNDAGATIKIILYGDADVVLDEDNPLVLRYVDTNILAQDFDANSVNTYDGVQATNSTSQGALDATPLTVSFDSENWDTDSYHDTVTNNSRITFPNTGRYRVTVSIQFAANATGYRLAFLQLNNTTNLHAAYAAAVTGAPSSVEFTYIGDFTASDYVQLFAQQNSGGTLNVTANESSPFITVQRID